MFNKKKLISAVISAVLCFSTVTVLPAQAACYTSYNYVYGVYDTFGNSKLYSMQGMAVGTSYIYCAKVTTYSSKAAITRYSIADNKNYQLKYIDQNGKSHDYFTNVLGHANDMFAHAENGKTYLYVATGYESGYQLVKLKVDGRKVYKVGQFNIKSSTNSNNISFSGITYLGTTDGYVKILVKKGKQAYYLTVGQNWASATVYAIPVFKIDTDNVKINGKSYPMNFDSNTGTHSHQGMHYTKGKLYVPVSRRYSNESVVIVYDNISSKINNALDGNAKGTQTAYSSNNLSFKVNDGWYNSLFEIESIGINDNGMYFNTNSQRNGNGNDADAVYKFNGFKA
ncbi:hypothetical protein [uncultured Ruminococcus sp.]|uniref:hypothetical protein n=1 Tax=uncultured Ruminococcus sp. TaxID=165186 RepID=UPI0025D70B4C|nr:hypothetical protein [uncultured Ruminococcus sp.]